MSPTYNYHKLGITCTAHQLHLHDMIITSMIHCCLHGLNTHRRTSEINPIIQAGGHLTANEIADETMVPNVAMYQLIIFADQG